MYPSTTGAVDIDSSPGNDVRELVNIRESRDFQQQRKSTTKRMIPGRGYSKGRSKFRVEVQG